MRVASASWLILVGGAVERAKVGERVVAGKDLRVRCFTANLRGYSGKTAKAEPHDHVFCRFSQ